MTAEPVPEVVPFRKAPSTPARGVRMRASDAERQATVRVLQDAMARGLLGYEEAGERMTAAWETRYRADLAPLTDDLPPAPEPSATPGWAVLGQQAAGQLRASLGSAFAGGPRSARAVVALGLTLLGLLTFLVLVGATMHALFDPGAGFGPGGWDGPHDHFGGP